MCTKTRCVVLDEAYRDLERCKYHLSAVNTQVIENVSTDGLMSFENLITAFKTAARPISLTFTRNSDLVTSLNLTP